MLSISNGTSYDISKRDSAKFPFGPTTSKDGSHRRTIHDRDECIVRQIQDDWPQNDTRPVLRSTVTLRSFDETPYLVERTWRQWICSNCSDIETGLALLSSPVAARFMEPVKMADTLKPARKHNRRLSSPLNVSASISYDARCVHQPTLLTAFRVVAGVAARNPPGLGATTYHMRRPSQVLDGWRKRKGACSAALSASRRDGKAIKTVAKPAARSVPMIDRTVTCTCTQ